MRFRLLFLLIIFCLILAACINDHPQDNKIYPAEHKNGEKEQISLIDTRIDTQGLIPFTKKLTDDMKHNRNHLLVSISPDGKSIYYMETTLEYKSPDQILIKGYEPENMDLYRLDIASGKSKLIAPSIAVISRASWNNSGILALLGGNHLTLYDAAKDRLLMADELRNEQVSHFGWSPDGKKIFTEHPNLPNGSILYPDSGSIVHKYETEENLYHKGKLDEDYSYGTYLYRPSEDELKQGVQEVAQTVVIDNKGQVVKIVGEGRFRDAYRRSVLQVGDSLFGLYYTPDINQADHCISLTEEYVYDARFIYDGKIIYIIKSPEAEKNTFLLCIADQEGKLLKKLEVSGNNLILSPDGKSVCTKGLENEEIDLTDSSFPLKKQIDPFPPRYVEEAIYPVIRGAVDSYCKFALTGELEQGILKKYFMDSHEPEQWAYFDMSLKVQEMKPSKNAQHYVVQIEIGKMRVDENKATFHVGFAASNSSGTGFGEGWVTELIKRDNRWYITGLSTFPNSQESKEVRQVAENYITSQSNSELKGKEVSIGQIQFWQLSDPHLAASSENANYCKIYLKVKESGKESIYKLVLHKALTEWKIESLSKDHLSGLF